MPKYTLIANLFITGNPVDHSLTCYWAYFSDVIVLMMKLVFIFNESIRDKS